MKVTDITVHILQAPLSEPFHWAIGEATARASAIVEITTDTGLVGWGECFGPAGPAAAMIEAYKPWLIDADPLASEKIWQDLYAAFRDQGQKGVPICAISGIDIALWDIRGKHFDAPIHQLMGGPLRREVKAYATGTYRKRSGDPLEYICDEVAGYAAEGFSAVKLKIGFEVREDAALIRAVRKVIGTDIGLMLDANHGYDAVDAIKLGKMVQDLDIGWFEEPVPAESNAALELVRPQLRAPISVGERLFTRFDFVEIFEKRLTDYVMPDICLAGGISEMRKIANMAEAYHLPFSPHNAQGTLQIVSGAQLCMTLPNFYRLEHAMTHISGYNRFLTEPLNFHDGKLTLSDKPGLGVEMDVEEIERSSIEIEWPENLN